MPPLTMIAVSSDATMSASALYSPSGARMMTEFEAASPWMNTRCAPPRTGGGWRFFRTSATLRASPAFRWMTCMGSTFCSSVGTSNILTISAMAFWSSSAADTRIMLLRSLAEMTTGTGFFSPDRGGRLL